MKSESVPAQFNRSEAGLPTGSHHAGEASKHAFEDSMHLPAWSLQATGTYPAFAA